MSELAILSSIERLGPEYEEGFVHYTVHVSLSWATKDGVVKPGEESRIADGSVDNRDLLLPWRWTSFEGLRFCVVRKGKIERLDAHWVPPPKDKRVAPDSPIYAELEKVVASLAKEEVAAAPRLPALWASGKLPHEQASDTTTLRDFVGYASTLSAPLPQWLNLAFVVRVEAKALKEGDVVMAAPAFRAVGLTFEPKVPDDKTVVSANVTPVDMWRWEYEKTTPGGSAVGAYSAGASAVREARDSAFVEVGSLWVRFGEPDQATAAGWFAEDWEARTLDRAAAALDLPKAILGVLRDDAASWAADLSARPTLVSDAETFDEIRQLFVAALRDHAHGLDLTPPGDARGVLERWWPGLAAERLAGVDGTALDVLREVLDRYESGLLLDGKAWRALLRTALPELASNPLVGDEAVPLPTSPDALLESLRQGEAIRASVTSDRGTATVLSELWRRALESDEEVELKKGAFATRFLPLRGGSPPRGLLSRGASATWRITWPRVDHSAFVGGDGAVTEFESRFEVVERIEMSDASIGVRLRRHHDDAKKLLAQVFTAKDGTETFGTETEWKLGEGEAPRVLQDRALSVRLALTFAADGKVDVGARLSSTAATVPLDVKESGLATSVVLAAAHARVTHPLADGILRVAWPTPDLGVPDDPPPSRLVGPHALRERSSARLEDDAAHRVSSKAHFGGDAWAELLKVSGKKSFDDRARLTESFDRLFRDYAEKRASGAKPTFHRDLRPRVVVADAHKRAILVERATALAKRDAQATLVPPTVLDAEGDVSPTPVAHPVRLPFDNLFAEPKAGTMEDFADWTRAVTGVAVLARQETRDGKAGAWRSLNLASLPQVLLGDKKEPCIAMVPLRSAYLSARRSSGVAYDNQPLLGKSPLLEYSESSTRQLRGEDPRARRLEHETTGPERLIRYDVATSVQNELATLPALSYGQRLDFAILLVGHSGSMPPPLCGRTSLDGGDVVYPVMLGKAADVATAVKESLEQNPHRLKRVHYLRRTPVGEPRWRSVGAGDVLPEVPDGVSPLAREFRRTGVVREKAAVWALRDDVERRGTLRLREGGTATPAPLHILARSVQVDGAGVQCALAVHADTGGDALLTVILARDQTKAEGFVEVFREATSIKRVDVTGWFDDLHEVDVEVSVAAPAGDEVRVRVAARRRDGGELDTETTPFVVPAPWTLGTETTELLGSVSVTLLGGALASAISFEPVARVDAPEPGEEADLPLLLLTEKPQRAPKSGRGPRMGPRLSFELAKPTIDLGTWDRWTRRDEWFATGDALTKIRELRAHVWDRFHLPSKDAGARTIEDPCVEPTMLVEAVPLARGPGTSAPAKAWTEVSTREAPVGGSASGVVEPVDPAPAQFSCEWTKASGATPVVEFATVGGEEVLRIAEGAVAEVRVHLLVKPEWFDAAKGRFPAAWATVLPEYRSKSGETFLLLPCRRFLVEAATAALPLASQVWESLRPTFNGTAVTVHVAPVPAEKSDAWLRFRYVKDVELRWQVWRWGGQPVTPFPFDVGDEDDDRRLYWDAEGFGHREDRDANTRDWSLALSPHPTEVLSLPLDSDLRAYYYRFALCVKSRYGPLVGGASMKSADPRVPVLLGWRRLAVPCRRMGEIAKPLVRTVLPLTEDATCGARQPGTPRRASGVLVVLDEGWFEYGGVGEALEASVAPAVFPEQTPERERLREVGADPVVAGSEAAGLASSPEFVGLLGQPRACGPDGVESPLADRLSPVGHTFDTDSSAPKIVGTSFYVPAPVQAIGDMRPLLKLRFRRRIRGGPGSGTPDGGAVSAWTSPAWCQMLPDAADPFIASGVRVEDHRLGASGGSWVLEAHDAEKDEWKPDALVARGPDEFDSGFRSVERWLLLTDVVFDANGRREDEAPRALLETVDGTSWRAANGPAAAWDPTGLLEVPGHAPRARILDVEARRERLPYPFKGTAGVEPRKVHYFGRPPQRGAPAQGSLAFEKDKPRSVVVRRVVLQSTGLVVDLAGDDVPHWSGEVSIAGAMVEVKEVDGGGTWSYSTKLPERVVVPKPVEFDLHFVFEIGKAPSVQARWSGGEWKDLKPTSGVPKLKAELPRDLRLQVALSADAGGSARFLAPVFCSSRAMEPWARLFPLDGATSEDEDARARVVSISPPIDSRPRSAT